MKEYFREKRKREEVCYYCNDRNGFYKEKEKDNRLLIVAKDSYKVVTKFVTVGNNLLHI